MIRNTIHDGPYTWKLDLKNTENVFRSRSGDITSELTRQSLISLILESGNPLAFTGLQVSFDLSLPGGHVLLVLLLPHKVDHVEIATDHHLHPLLAGPEGLLQLLGVSLLEHPPALPAPVEPDPLLAVLSLGVNIGLGGLQDQRPVQVVVRDFCTAEAAGSHSEGLTSQTLNTNDQVITAVWLLYWRVETETYLGTEEAEHVTTGQSDGVDGRVETDGALLTSPGGTLRDDDTFQQVGHHHSTVRQPGYLGSGLSIITIVLIIVVTIVVIILTITVRKGDIRVILIAVDDDNCTGRVRVFSDQRKGGIRVIGAIQIVVILILILVTVD